MWALEPETPWCGASPQVGILLVNDTDVAPKGDGWETAGGALGVVPGDLQGSAPAVALKSHIQAPHTPGDTDAQQ